MYHDRVEIFPSTSYSPNKFEAFPVPVCYDRRASDQRFEVEPLILVRKILLTFATNRPLDNDRQVRIIDENWKDFRFDLSPPFFDKKKKKKRN